MHVTSEPVGILNAIFNIIVVTTISLIWSILKLVDASPLKAARLVKKQNIYVSATLL